MNCPLLDAPGPEVSSHIIRQLLSPLDALDVRERMILLERIYWRTDMADIARALKINEPRTYYLFKRGKTKLK